MKTSGAAGAPSGRNNVPDRWGCWAPVLTFGAILFFVLGRAACYELHEGPILRDGTPAKARVLEIKPTGGSINDDLKVRIDLEVQPKGREAYRAEVVTYMHPVNFPRYQPGALVDVRFDPNEPSDVVLVPPVSP